MPWDPGGPRRSPSGRASGTERPPGPTAGAPCASRASAPASTTRGHPTASERIGGGRKAGDASVAASIAMVLAAVAFEVFVVVGWQLTSPWYSATRVFGSILTGLAFVACGVVARHRSSFP